MYLWFKQLAIQQIKTEMNTYDTYKIEKHGSHFVVSDGYNMYGSYYKTIKGAEKQLLKVRKAAGVAA